MVHLSQVNTPLISRHSQDGWQHKFTDRQRSEHDS